MTNYTLKNVGSINGVGISSASTPEEITVGYNYYETNGIVRWLDSYYKDGNYCSIAGDCVLFFTLLSVRLPQTTVLPFAFLFLGDGFGHCLLYSVTNLYL